MKRNLLKEKETSQDHPLEENQSLQELLLSFSLVLIEEEELLLSKIYLQETFSLQGHMLSMEFHFKELTQPTWLPLQQKFPLTV